MIGFITLLIISFSIVTAVYSWNTNKNIIFFSLFLIILSLSIYLYDLLIYGGSLYHFTILFLNTGPLYFLPGPFIFFFIRGNIQDTQGFKKYDYLHFLPFFIDLTIWYPQIISPFEEKLEFAKLCMQNVDYYLNASIHTPYPHLLHNFLRGLHITIYIVLSLIMLIRFYPEINNLKSIAGRKHLSTLKWLIALMIIILTGTTLHSLIFVKYFSGNNFFFFNSININIINFIAIVTLIIPVMFMAFPAILLGMPGISAVISDEKKKENANQQDVRLQNEEEANQLIRKSQFMQNNSGYFDELSQKIIRHMEIDKPFLNPKFKINNLTINLNVPQHHIQFCINNLLNTTFSDFKNKYRILYAQKLIAEGYLGNKTMESLSSETGYASLSNFYAEFKKITGNTPLQIHKNSFPDLSE